MEDTKKAKFLILKAALDEIAESGVGNARTSSIAKRAGVTSGLLHYYYGTKENLIKAIINHLFDQELIEGITVIPFHRECSPVEKLQVILYSIVECNFKEAIYNIVRFYQQLMVGERELLNNLMDYYDFFAERYIISVINEGIKQKYFNIEHPSIFAMDLIFSVTPHMSMHNLLQGRSEQEEFFPDPFFETFKEYFIDASMRKILIPEKVSKIKALDDDLKRVVDIFINLLSKREVISSWHMAMRLIMKLFKD